MLSRVADNLYWMSRYLERAEHTARLVDVNLNLMLDQPHASDDQRWGRLLASLHAPSPVKGTNDPYSITEMLTFDLPNKSSIVACITAARDNARQVREQISSEMWEQLNRLFLQVKRANMAHIWHVQPHEFFRSVKEGAHLFQGITDSTLTHGEGWHFVQVGRFIERAGATAVLLDVHLSTLLNPPDEASQSDDYLEWIGLLKSCTAFEAYCKVHTADRRPDRIVEFLLLNAEFPHSIRFAADVMQTALQAIAESVGGRKPERVDRLAGRLRAMLDFGQLDEIMAGGLHRYLEEVQRQCEQIHEALYQAYISYPIESALAS
jgi:uncharacterized alpha-E superfamily protein